MLSFGLATVRFVFPLFNYASFDSSEESDEELLDVAIFVFYLFTMRFCSSTFSALAGARYPAFSIILPYLAPRVR